VRQLLRSIDPEMPIYDVSTMTEETDRSLWQERLLATLMSAFGAFALALSALGLYGIMTYFVTRRRREIGVCMALGAGRADILRLVVRRVVPTFSCGLAAGVALAWFESAWIRSLLYGVQPFDAVASIATILLLVGIGSAAAAVPAYRAMQVHPASALRQD
jgi:putative ABC transport system permease protein